MDNEFDLASDLEMGEQVVSQTKPKSLKKQQPPRVAASEILDDEEAKPEKGKIRIMIDEVAGMSNYETVGVNGNIIQIKRGVPVWVKPEYVHALENAVMTHIEKRENPLTGENDTVVRHYAAIPWRRV